MSDDPKITSPTGESKRLAEANELLISYQGYCQAYDYSLDSRPPLDFIAWVATYGEDILREAREARYI